MSQSPTSSRRLRFGRYDYGAFLSFFSYACASLVIATALPTIASDLGFPLEEGGTLKGGIMHFGRTAAMAITLVLCGFWAGRWGKRITLGISVAMIGVGIIVGAFAPAYIALVAGLVIAGLGEGILEGLATPYPNEPGRYLNIAHGFWPIGSLTTAIGTGLLLYLGVSWRYVLAGIGVMALLASLVLLLPQRKGHEYPEHPEIIPSSVVWGHVLSVLRTPRAWLFLLSMFIAGAAEFGPTFWISSFVETVHGGSKLAGGVGLGCLAAGMMVGRLGWGYLIKQHQLARLVVLSALAGVVATSFLPFLGPLWALFGMLFVTGIAMAPFWPSIQSHADHCLPHTDSTMFFILLSCAGIAGCGVMTMAMGAIAKAVGSLRMTFLMIPALQLILAALLIVEARIKPINSEIS
ncbi:MAG: MFS transporter [Planctomycetota bacterium]